MTKCSKGSSIESAKKTNRRITIRGGHTVTPIGLGFRVIRGGSVVVGVSAGDREPRVVLSTLLATAAEGDRLSLEPYYVASQMMRGADGGASAEAAAAVAEGRASDRSASRRRAWTIS